MTPPRLTEGAIRDADRPGRGPRTWGNDRRPPGGGGIRVADFRRRSRRRMVARWPGRRFHGGLPESFTLQFPEGSAALSLSAEYSLNTLVEWMAAQPDFRVLVTGHSDATGNERTNMELSRRRAQVVRYYLLEHGVIPSGWPPPISGKAGPNGAGPSTVGWRCSCWSIDPQAGFFPRASPLLHENRLHRPELCATRCGTRQCRSIRAAVLLQAGERHPPQGSPLCHSRMDGGLPLRGGGDRADGPGGQVDRGGARRHAATRPSDWASISPRATCSRS